MPMMNYHDRLVKRREKRVVKKASGKDLIFNEFEMLDFIRGNQVPVMVQHCILKVYRKMRGSGRERFLSAFNICSAVFQNNGYLWEGRLKMSGKGVKRNRMHQREKEASSKRGKYKRMIDVLWRSALNRQERKSDKDRSMRNAVRRKEKRISSRESGITRTR